MIETRDKLHQKRMNEKEAEPMVVNKDEFDDIVEKFKNKNKLSYNFQTKAGNSFENSVSKLCRRLIKDKEVPKRVS